MQDVELVDLFAMVALHGHLTNPKLKDLTYNQLAEICYEMAEAMVEIREER